MEHGCHQDVTRGPLCTHTWVWHIADRSSVAADESIKKNQTKPKQSLSYRSQRDICFYFLLLKLCAFSEYLVSHGSPPSCGGHSNIESFSVGSSRTLEPTSPMIMLVYVGSKRDAIPRVYCPILVLLLLHRNIFESDASIVLIVSFASALGAPHDPTGSARLP